MQENSPFEIKIVFLLKILDAIGYMATRFYASV